MNKNDAAKRRDISMYSHGKSRPGNKPTSCVCVCRAVQQVSATNTNKIQHSKYNNTAVPSPNTLTARMDDGKCVSQAALHAPSLPSYFHTIATMAKIHARSKLVMFSVKKIKNTLLRVLDISHDSSLAPNIGY